MSGSQSDRNLSSRDRPISGRGATLVAILATTLAPLNAAAQSHPMLFGTSEIHGSAIGNFPKWTRMLARMRTTPEPFDDLCESPSGRRCHLKEWNAFLRSLEGTSPRHQLDEVNAFMNNFPYITDIVNWGVRDYWETPLEFLDRSGNCKDYAIAKFMSLRFLGWKNDDVRVVVLQDLNLGVPHAVMVAYLAGQALVLDNQVAPVMNAANIHHYRPFYSINEVSWWLHLHR